MKRGKQIRVLLLLLTMVLATAWFTLWTAQREPEFNGKSLSEWAMLYQESCRLHDLNSQKQAIDAAHQTRDQLVPYALKLLEYQPPSWRAALGRKLAGSGFDNRIPSGLWKFINYDPGWLSNTYFVMLGPDANAVVPELTSLLNENIPGEVYSRATYALCYIGKDGHASLAGILNDPRHPSRRAITYIVEDVEKQGVNVHDLVPSLIRNLADSDHKLSKAAAYSLGEMAIEPEIVVPALTNCLQSPDIYVRGAALDALAKFGDRARPVVPALVTELDDPDPSVRKWATNTLTHVVPEYFTLATNWLSLPIDLSMP